MLKYSYVSINFTLTAATAGKSTSKQFIIDTCPVSSSAPKY